MGTGQMIFVILTVVLFTSIMMSTYTNMLSQLSYVYEGNALLQGHKLAEQYISYIDLKLKTMQGGETFSSIITSAVNAYNNSTYRVYIIPGDNTKYIDYNVQMTAANCNRAGDTSSPSALYVLVNIRITTNYLSKNLQIGTTANPISAIFADNGLL